MTSPKTIDIQDDMGGRYALRIHLQDDGDVIIAMRDVEWKRSDVGNVEVCASGSRVPGLAGRLRAAFAPQMPAGERLLAFYRENGYRFLVEAVDTSDAEMTRYEMRVLHVFANDPWHGIQYKAGDRFSCSVSKVQPGASGYSKWKLEQIAPVPTEPIVVALKSERPADYAPEDKAALVAFAATLSPVDWQKRAEKAEAERAALQARIAEVEAQERESRRYMGGWHQRAQEYEARADKAEASLAKLHKILNPEKRTYRWLGDARHEIGYPHLTDREFAGKVRMLSASDILEHEPTVTAARDRIMHLSEIVEQARAIVGTDSKEQRS